MKQLQVGMLCIRGSREERIPPDLLNFAGDFINGFRIDILGIAMQKGNDVGYNRLEVYITVVVK
jgi:hypothetical protein